MSIDSNLLKQIDAYVAANAEDVRYCSYQRTTWTNEADEKAAAECKSYYGNLQSLYNEKHFNTNDPEVKKAYKAYKTYLKEIVRNECEKHVTALNAAYPLNGRVKIVSTESVADSSNFNTLKHIMENILGVAVEGDYNKFTLETDADNRKVFNVPQVDGDKTFKAEGHIPVCTPVAAIAAKEVTAMQKAWDADRKKGAESALTDRVLIESDGTKHFAHSPILATLFGYFDATTDGPCATMKSVEKDGKIEITFKPNDPVTSLGALLDYVYTGEAPALETGEDIAAMYDCLSFLAADFESAEIKRLVQHLHNRAVAVCDQSNVFQFVELAQEHRDETLGKLCTEKLCSYIKPEDGGYTEDAFNAAIELKNKPAFMAIVSKVISNKAGFAAANTTSALLAALKGCVLFEEQAPARFIMQALRTQIMADPKRFGEIFELISEHGNGAVDLSPLMEVCKYFALRSPGVLAPYISKRSLEFVSKLDADAIRALAAEAAELGCNEVRFVCAEAMTQYVTEKNYEEVCAFIKANTADLENKEAYSSCMKLIKGKAKSDLGELPKGADANVVLEYIAKAASLESWKLLGKALLVLAKEHRSTSKTYQPIFDQYRHVADKSKKTKAAYALIDAEGDEESSESE